MSDLQVLQKIAEKRRSVYVLNDQLPVPQQDIINLVEHTILHTPSAFNSQSSRIVVLFGKEHEKVWEITEDILRSIVGDIEKFKPTEEKLNLFKAGAGTILFFEDQRVVKGLQDKFVVYADRFPIWAEQVSAMHQYAIWTTLASLNVGANLQHYNPIIDEKVASTWNIDKNWKLIAQMVFGGIVQPATEKNFQLVDNRLKVFK